MIEDELLTEDEYCLDSVHLLRSLSLPSPVLSKELFCEEGTGCCCCLNSPIPPDLLCDFDPLDMISFHLKPETAFRLDIRVSLDSDPLALFAILIMLSLLDS